MADYISLKNSVNSLQAKMDALIALIKAEGAEEQMDNDAITGDDDATTGDDGSITSKELSECFLEYLDTLDKFGQYTHECPKCSYLVKGDVKCDGHDIDVIADTVTAKRICNKCGSPVTVIS